MRELKIRYKRSALGIAWSLLNPLSQIIILAFLFRSVLDLNIPHYASFVFVGVLAWTWFSGAVTTAAFAITSNAELVRRPGFPTYVLPLITVASNGVHFVLALPMMLVVTVLDGGRVGASLLCLPAVMAAQFAFTAGLAYFVAATHVRFRDTQHLVSIATMLAFYLTPVFYSSAVVPAQYRFLHYANPMAVLLDAYRSILMDGVWPSLVPLAGLTIASCCVLATGMLLFRRMSLSFAEEI
ncbi:ABC transporter permease [Bradyrhizobium glycinis]|uniref:ABC transporter permease n=1 Tax=Bradyrhizobium glycinis TaxID=2751812 RepID=UPI0018D5B88F|nr:ABC transporter permease [Bradyrhizobium glycinis]